MHQKFTLPTTGIYNLWHTDLQHPQPDVTLNNSNTTPTTPLTVVLPQPPFLWNLHQNFPPNQEQENQENQEQENQKNQKNQEQENQENQEQQNQENPENQENQLNQKQENQEN